MSTTGARRLPMLPAAAFVLVWSTGYIAGPYGVESMSPLMLVAVRFAIAALIGLLLARILRGPMRIPRPQLGRIAVTGFVYHGVTFASMYLAFAAGLGATLGALVHSLSPVLTALLAAVLLRERLTGIQVAGFLVGVGGVLLVLGPDLDDAGGVVGIIGGLVSMLALSLGTLGQRWSGEAVDPIWAATVQFAAAAPPLLVLAVIVEGVDGVIIDPVGAMISLAWLAVVNSIVGLLLLGVLVRARGAGVAASIFFLMPPVTAVMAWLILGDTLGGREVAGLFITVAGVAAATRAGRARPQDEGVNP